MVYLKSYECHSCHTLCKGYSAKGHHWSTDICEDCGYLICGKCSFFEDEEKKCVVTGKACEFFYCSNMFFDYVTQIEPDDELKLLNYGKWSPVRCEECNASITTKNKVFRCDGNDSCDSYYCTKCLPDDAVPKQPPIDTFMKIIKECRGYFSGTEEDCIDKRGIRLESLKCTACMKHLAQEDSEDDVQDEEEEGEKDDEHEGEEEDDDEEEEDDKEEEDEDEDEEAYIYLSETAAPHCSDCSDEFVHSYAMLRPSICDTIINLLAYIPDTNDLKLLTYSKWTPLRCEACSIVLSEEYNRLPMFHPDCRKIICNLCSGTHDCTLVEEEEDEEEEGGDYGYDHNGHDDDDDCDDEERTKSPIVLAKFLVDVILEFRALFKNGGRDIEAISSPDAKDQQEQKTPKQKSSNKNKMPLENVTKLETSTVPLSAMQGSYAEDKLSSLSLQDQPALPNTVSCVSCSRCTDATEARNCLDCEMYGICLPCLAEEHWGHKMMKAEEGMNRVSIQDDSASTLRKLARWKGPMDDVHAQGVAAQRLLCDSYESAYISSLNSGNPVLTT